MKLQGKRIAILAENMYQEMELWVPYYRLKEEGAEVKVVGAGGAKSYTSKHGYPAGQRARAETHAEGAPRLADRDLRPHDSGAVLARERLEMTAGVQHRHG